MNPFTYNLIITMGGIIAFGIFVFVLKYLV